MRHTLHQFYRLPYNISICSSVSVGRSQNCKRVTKRSTMCNSQHTIGRLFILKTHTMYTRESWTKLYRTGDNISFHSDRSGDSGDSRCSGESGIEEKDSSSGAAGLGLSTANFFKAMAGGALAAAASLPRSCGLTCFSCRAAYDKG